MWLRPTLPEQAPLVSYPTPLWLNWTMAHSCAGPPTASATSECLASFTLSQQVIFSSSSYSSSATTSVILVILICFVFVYLFVSGLQSALHSVHPWSFNRQNSSEWHNKVLCFLQTIRYICYIISSASKKVRPVVWWGQTKHCGQ